MNKTIRNIAALSLALITIAACKKSDDNNTTPATTSVNINGTKYTQYQGVDAVSASLFGHTVYELGAVGKTDDGKSFAATYLYSLANIRPAAGTYNIGGSSTTFTANQLQILVNDSSAAGGGLYSADTVTSVNATVAVVDGKVTATIPGIRLHGLYTPAGGTTYNDTITFSGTVKVQ